MDYITFASKSTSPYQLVGAAAEILEEKGFEKLDFGAPFALKTGEKYYTVPYGTSLFAFTIGQNYKAGGAMRIAGAHTDFPCFKIKPQPEMCDHDYLKLDVDVYGGPILSSWLDRPLSIAGRVMVKSRDLMKPDSILVDFGRPLLTIPNLAIHMNREINKGYEYNKQTELLPILGMLDEKLSRDHFLTEALAAEINKAIPEPDRQIDADDILDFDLYVYACEKAEFLGLNGELLSGPRLDNHTSCHAIISAISETEDARTIQLAALYDNEEVGSRSKQGADSQLTGMLLEKIYAGLGMDRSLLNDAVYNSFMLSADVAHAYHPNYPQKYDPINHCILNKGFVIKTSSTQKYATDTEAIAIAKQLCDHAGIPYQMFANRSDIAGGGTIGTISSSFLPCKTVDVGVPILAMHSARETMGVKDQVYLYQLMKVFYRA